MEIEELRAECKKRDIEKTLRGMDIASANKGKLIAVLEAHMDNQEDE